MPKTGDLIFFSNIRFKVPEERANSLLFLKNLFAHVATFISTKIYARYAYHIGMIVEKRHVPQALLPASDDDLFIWETRFQKSVGFNSYYRRILEKDETIFIRAIEPHLSDEHIFKLQNFFIDTHGMSFNINIWDLMSAFLDIPSLPKNESGTTYMICSELIVETLKTLNILEDGIASKEILPDDFVSHRQTFEFENGFNYNTEIFM